MKFSRSLLYRNCGRARPPRVARECGPPGQWGLAFQFRSRVYNDGCEKLLRLAVRNAGRVACGPVHTLDSSLSHVSRTASTAARTVKDELKQFDFQCDTDANN